MAARNANRVCFDCRAAVRRSPWIEGDVRCPGCGRPCRALFTTPVPPKRDAAAWRELRQALRRAGHGLALRDYLTRLRPPRPGRPVPRFVRRPG